MRKELLKAITEGHVSKFYKGREWISKRKDILKRDNNECQKCKSKGGFHKAECVHHIKRLREFPELGLEDSNLISLCNVCHNIEHPEKLHGDYKNHKKKKVKFMNVERWE